ncbi:hypothetical protein [Bremerella sp. P1]|uniref:hypothetical protein n=1 Tax=Bremerella sp. P1 TaxID=3026424 RepID=UPI002367D7AE|nr:hypothetical protein [Bremerella sp. P1]WDI40340.1 hypothetical protein PSR63_17830 [Bremerella sp. P1]
MPTRIHCTEAESYGHEFEPTELRFAEESDTEIRLFDEWHLSGHWIFSPPLIPYVPEEEIVSRLQQCPQCQGVICVSEPGFTYCTRCIGLICVSEQLEILQPSSYGLQCPQCLGHLEEDDFDSWEVGILCCHLCGNVMDWKHLSPDGLQVLTPGEEVFWPLDTDLYAV